MLNFSTKIRLDMLINVTLIKKNMYTVMYLNIICLKLFARDTQVTVKD